jgi:hypothetical protein
MSLLVVDDSDEFVDAAGRRVVRWRREQFLRLGFTPLQARELASSDADLGSARRLTAAGCPLGLCFAILS